MRFLAAREELLLKRLKIDEAEKIQDETDSLEKEIQKLRAAHTPDADARADRLRERVTTRALLLASITTGLSVPASGGGDSNQTGNLQATN